MHALEGLEPKRFWDHFYALTQIPRCSGDEAAVSAHVQGWAAALGFACEIDEVGNVLVRVPATPGHEGAEITALQGHLDMVCEKHSTHQHDFATDPLRLLRAGEWIVAEGTSLGADNGVAIAAAMAVAEDPEAVHGPLELLFTVDEERGLVGAFNLKGGWLKATRLLNLDTEEEGSLYIGCSGGGDTWMTLPLHRARIKHAHGLKVRLHGLKGGHSGLDINLGRGNAIQILARLLDGLGEGCAYQLLDLQGGTKHNAIPREAIACLAVADLAAFEAALEGFQAEIAEIYGVTEPGIAWEIEPLALAGEALCGGSLNALLWLLGGLPHGVITMSQAVNGLVETSNNLAIVRLEAAQARVQISTRSSNNARLRQTRAGIFGLARLAGASVEAEAAYPGWQPNPDSPLLALAKAVHEATLGSQPEIKAIHAGLECGIIGERYPGMDMISFGPTMRWPHSPSEELHIASSARFYRLLCALLAALS
ncbi:aminoacyl-histidine dipeptidase [Myxococcota bacterium]|nr:aminoacyl-histidine dipeptidase [Myxococcota bacterium]MBU1430365.1 aminoacyl-histidine dipeptidase [Myxococcota bacterium]MBU1897592.1 aminoacyl-histidine dipeptidase [Myxococcota bacterium]